MSKMPFSPPTSTLRQVLLTKYIKNVALWLMGKEENSVLAQVSNSSWEAALTIIFLADVHDLYAQTERETELREIIHHKIPEVTRWLLSQQIKTEDGHVCWENVTWDTSVIVRAILTALKKYPNSFSSTEKQTIIDTVINSCIWLHCQFSGWETQVKYFFGPADIAQIVITILHIATEFPEVYERISSEYYRDRKPSQVAIEIVKYLLSRKTEKTLMVKAETGIEENIVTYWWDDFYSTAEVLEALAVFYRYYQSHDIGLDKTNLLNDVKEAIVSACGYLEQEQVEGMWGTHVDTIRVLTTYVTVRRMIPQRESNVDDLLIEPEMHITFKALRWMCDEKQIFADGSFMHTMFLTIFYAIALVEVYRSWEPACDSIEKIYDDVLWYSPVRTTPERSKRLAAELRNSTLSEQLALKQGQIKDLSNSLQKSNRVHAKLICAGSLIFVAIALFFLIGSRVSVLHASVSIKDWLSLWGYLAVFITILISIITIFWNYDKIFVSRYKSDNGSVPANSKGDSE